MLKPHLWSKSVNSVSEVYWWIKCIEAGKDYYSYNNLEELIIDLTSSEDDQCTQSE